MIDRNEFYLLALENDQENEGFLSGSHSSDYYSKAFSENRNIPDQQGGDFGRVFQQVNLATKDPSILAERRRGFYIAIGCDGKLASASTMRLLLDDLEHNHPNAVNTVLKPLV